MDYPEETRVLIKGKEEDGEAQEPNILLKELEEKLKEKENLYLQSLADFQNYRKRVDQEKEKDKQRVKKDLLREFLEIVDNLERAIDCGEKDGSPFNKGVKAIHRQIMDLLKKNGVTAIESMGKEFDPHFHEAVGVIGSNDFSSGIIGMEMKKGYLMEGELLRPSRVLVVK
jgi:molecular chaperone GrpE